MSSAEEELISSNELETLLDKDNENTQNVENITRRIKESEGATRKESDTNDRNQYPNRFTLLVAKQNRFKLAAIGLFSASINKKKGHLNVVLNEDCEDPIRELYQAIKTSNDSMFVERLNSLSEKVKKEIRWFFYNDDSEEANKKYTLLQAVSKFGMLESYKALINLNANPSYMTQTSDKHHPIQLSCLFAKPEILEHLLQNIEEKFLKTKHNRNLLHLSVKNRTDFKNSERCLQILLKDEDRVTEVNLPDDRGKTPLHYAVRNDNDACTVKLLQNGALIDVEDNSGQTPLMLISKSALEKYLDEMITETTKKSGKSGKNPGSTELQQGDPQKDASSKRNLHQNNESNKNLSQGHALPGNPLPSDLPKSNLPPQRKISQGHNPVQEKSSKTKKEEERILEFNFKHLFRIKKINNESKDIPDDYSACFPKFERINSLIIYLALKAEVKKTTKKENSTEDEKGDYIFPTDLLYQIKESENLKELIQHPILSLIIHFKWRQIQYFFYGHLILYLTFCLTYTAFILLSEDKPEYKVTAKTKLLTALGYDRKSRTYFSSLNLFLNANNMALYFMIPLLFLVAIFIFFEVVKIAHQKCFDPNRKKWYQKCICCTCLINYFKDLDNAIRIIVIFLTIFVLVSINSSSVPFASQLKAISILMTWIELFLVFGKYPKLSFYVTIFRSASLHLFKFVFIHFALLLGFAFSFHTLFRTTNKENPFTNPYNAIFKTIVMLTSEFDAGEIPFKDYAVISHFIFVFYIFIATIVLFNLMIGIAFKRVNEMETNPFLYQCLAEIDIIKHYEENFRQNIILQPLFQLLSPNPYCKEKQKEQKDNNSEDFKITWSNEKFDAYFQFEIDPLDKVRKVITRSNFCENVFFGNKPSSKIIKQAKKIASKRMSKSEGSMASISTLTQESFENKINELEKLVKAKFLNSQNV